MLLVHPYSLLSSIKARVVLGRTIRAPILLLAEFVICLLQNKHSGFYLGELLVGHGARARRSN